ncbi:MAG: UDP-N-acetylmuramoyl-L-alanyl-D-glutamate--2,6-diaminopimelate ligase [Chloroflexi bacterium]|nr:UDP-N-acetylmuramoyl-L-alanyl-D-glutamate--2,6-diaminopimelate ligase [Chloroflexota bacterium]
MLLSQLLDQLPDVLERPAQDVLISAPVSEDSRTVQRGGLFVARRGANTDSHDLIGEAIANGAAAVIGERPAAQVQCSVPYAQVADAQQALGYLAAAYHGFPSRALTVIGVTGTDGKTTTTSLIFNMLKCAGVPAGMISTVSAVIGDEALPTGLHVTTPTAPEVQSYLRRMVAAGLTHCVIETTSHGLAQGRVNGVEYDIAVLTNVTHEHLDFHGSFENYRAAKGLLFSRLAESYPKAGVPKCAVINLDDPNADYFLALSQSVRQITYSARGYGQVNLLNWRAEPSGIHATLLDSAEGVSIAFHTALIGVYNLQNILAAASAALALSIPSEAIKRGIETLPPIPGRMERIDEGQNFTAIVDFAHTPNALEKALQTARSLTNGRVIAVFGSAGLRDVEKRRLMAEVGVQLADICVLTAEDPRTEPLDAILEMMAEGARRAGGVEGKTFFRVPDRGAALAFACQLARQGDVVIACGKGHEQSMCFGEIEYPWDDREAMRAALRGTPLKTLPTASL